MSPNERWWRRCAEGLRAEEASMGRPRAWLDRYAREADGHAELALDGFTLDEPCGWSVVAALAGSPD